MMHRHQWGDDSRYYVPGSTRGSVSGSEGTLQRFLFGITTVSQRCTKCGKLKSYVATGDAR